MRPVAIYSQLKITQMKVLLKSNEKSAEFIKDFEARNHEKYVPTIEDALPSYIKCDENFEVITKEALQYDEKNLGYKRVQIPVVFTQHQINSFRKFGHFIEVITDKEIKEVDLKKREFKLLLEKARIEGIKEAEQAHKINDKKSIIK